MPDIEHDLDHAIGARFGSLQGSVAAAVPLPGVEEIIARGRRRRRNGQAALGGLAVLAVLAVASVVFGPLRPDGGPLPPVDPTPTASSYAPPPGAARAPVGGTIPVGFLSMKLGTVEARLQSQCDGQAALSTNGHVTSAASSVDGSVTLLLYPRGVTASQAYTEYRAEAERCLGAIAGTTRKIERVTFGAEGFTLISSKRPKPDFHQVVVRFGRALLLVSGETDTTVRRAGAIERSLCVFGDDCRARERLPKALPAMTVGGEAWAAVLAISPTADDVRLGQAVAWASEKGYRTSVASVDCDAGARERLGLAAGSTHRYVSVYFSGKEDAETFAAQTEMTQAIVPVRTYCLG